MWLGKITEPKLSCLYFGDAKFRRRFFGYQSIFRSVASSILEIVEAKKQTLTQ